MWPLWGNMILSNHELRESLEYWQVPNVIKRLDEYIIGQTYAKEALANLVFSRMLRKLQKWGYIDGDITLPKSNVLLIGSTGVGKTALVKAVEDVTGFPITRTDITGVTSGGYVGEKIEDLLFQHVQHVTEYLHLNKHKMVIEDVEDPVTLQRFIESGIMFIDEIDKACKKGDRGEDITGLMVQNELLKCLEGRNIVYSRDKHHNSPLTINTTDVCFILGGAFDGINPIINKRLSGSNMGFLSSVISTDTDSVEYYNLREKVTTRDIIRYGFKDEFVGRISQIVPLRNLDLSAMVKIITLSKNSIMGQYIAQFKLFGIDLILTPCAVEYIAKCALDLKLGARSLNSLFDKIMLPHLVNLFSYTTGALILTKQDIAEKLDEI